MTDRAPAIRVLIADDHDIVRIGLRSLLERQSDLLVVGEAATVPELVARAREVGPDVIVTDLRMPLGNVADVIAVVRRDLPNTRVVVFSAFDEPVEAAASLRAGAVAYVLKQSDGSDVITAVRRAHAGRRFVDESLAARVLEDIGMDGAATPAPSPELSQREGRVLELIARGYTGPQIAVELGVRLGTVDSYRHRIRRKLGLKSRAEVMDYARRTGLNQRRG